MDQHLYKMDLPEKPYKIQKEKHLPLYRFDNIANNLTSLEDVKCLPAFIDRQLIRPYNAYCMMCKKSCSNYANMLNHTQSEKHEGNLQKKTAIGVISQEYNVFFFCHLESVFLLVQVYFPLQKHTELVVATDDYIFSEVCDYYCDEMSQKACVVPVNCDSCFYFNNFVMILDRSCESEESNSKLVCIYDFSVGSVGSLEPVYADLYEWCSRNLSYSCQVWCSICSLKMRFDQIQEHVVSVTHPGRDYPYLAGLYCRPCDAFFICLFFERMVHVHSNELCKQPIKDGKLSQLRFTKDLNDIYTMPQVTLQSIQSSINKVQYRLPFKKSELTFLCLMCSVQILNWSTLEEHLYNDIHLEKVTKNRNKFTCICTGCKMFLMSDKKRTLLDHIHLHKFGEKIDIEDMVVRRDIAEGQEDLRYLHPKLVKFSRSAFQLTHPGISEDDFNTVKEFTIESLDNYIQDSFYSLYSPLKKLYFICLECSGCKMDKQAFIGHVRHKKHCLRLRTSDSQIFYVKICDLCQVLFIGSNFDLFQRHFTSVEHNGGLKHRLEFLKEQIESNGSGSMKYGWSGDLSPSCCSVFSSILTLCSTVEAYIKDVENALQSSSLLLGMVEHDILNIVRSRYPNVQIHFFGSRVSGLAKTDSDVDIFLDLGCGGGAVVEVATLFNDPSSLFSVKRVVDTAKVPVIILEHVYTSLRCDINIQDCSGVYNTLLVRTYVRMDPRVLWLLTAVREWATLNGICGCKKFTSYALTWLVLFFLMQPDVSLIPPVTLLRSLYMGKSVFCSGWDFSFESDVEAVKTVHNPRRCTKTPLELLELFFHFYSILKTKKIILFPNTGEILSRSYFVRQDVGRGVFDNPYDTQNVKIGGSFILIDPFKLKDNILRSVDENLSDHFRLTCQQTLNCGWRQEEDQT